MVLGGALAAGLAVDRAAAQSVGPRISPAHATVDSLIPPGTRADLIPLVVRNEGGDPLAVTMGAAADDPPAASWVSFNPSTFALASGEARVVHTRVAVPRDAADGPQRLRLRATTSTTAPTEGLGLGFSVAVASVVDFTIGWPTDASGAPIEGNASRLTVPMVLLVLGVALLAGAGSYRLSGWATELEWRSPVTRRRRDE